MYDLELPPDTAPGDEFGVDVGQQLGPDEADKFVIATQLADSQTAGQLLFRLAIALEVNGGTGTVETGEFVFSVPGELDEKWTYATDASEEQLARAFGDKPADGDRVRECLYGNSENLHRFLAAPGARPADLEDVDANLRLRP